MYAFAIPLAYVGTVTPLGLAGLVLAILAEMVAPAAVNYYRFASGEWKAVSRGYRPDASPGGD
jgi:Na+-driven multidrug efflux pump